MSEPRTTDYCHACGESPDSATHWTLPASAGGHAYVDPRGEVASHDPTFRHAHCRRVLLVGEMNPYGGSPAFALWDEPADASGARLRAILGLRSDTYRALHRANLCAGRWELPVARGRASRFMLCEPSRPWEVVVMLGRKVASAFRYRGAFFSAQFPRSAPGLQGRPEPTLVSLPHPSGLCRLWHEPSAVQTARSLLRKVAHCVPWGEADPDDYDVPVGGA